MTAEGIFLHTLPADPAKRFAGKRRKRAQRIRGFANSGDSFRRGRFRRASGGPIFSVLPEKIGEKRGAGLRLVPAAGMIQASLDFFSRYEHTYSPYGRYGTRRLSWYDQVCEQLPLNGCGKSALHSKFAGQYEFAGAPTTLVRTASEILSCFKLRGKDPRKPKRFSWAL